ncbi:MAG: WYL domain-containing protein [Gammaproteobacteria bacterium]|nr:WYL domain-containing protein [Gammaproteobacteria bacterium]
MTTPRREITDTLQFALDVLALIPHRLHKTAKDIHDELAANSIHRDLRSVQRMLKTLSDFYPQLEVYTDRKPYGYKWGTQAPKIMLPSMSSIEALLLVMSQNYLRHFLPQDLNNSLQSYFSEANVVLKAHATDQSAKDWLEKVRFSPPTQPLIPPEIDPEIIETVTHCLFNNLEMALTYQNRRGEVSEYVVHPFGLIDRAPVLYLVGDSLRVAGADQRIRTYAAHRMIKARQLSHKFDRPVDFDLDEYVTEGRHMFGKGERVQLTFEIRGSPGMHLQEAHLSADQDIEELDDGWLRVSATVSENLELKRWMNSFGEDIRAIDMTFLDDAHDQRP